MATTTDTPYCGAPPAPDELWGNWNLDPVLIAALAAILAGYVGGAARHGRALRLSGWRRASFHGGWLVLAAMLVSPLCNLTVALFSARVGQHLALTLVAAPLMMLGRPQDVIAAALPKLGAWRRAAAARIPFGGPAPAALLFAVFIWLWHLPGPYAATFDSTAVYWLMHLTLIASALMLWRGLFDPRPGARLRALVAALATAMQMGLLGAVIALSARPLYDVHAATTWPWGLMPLQDQQLGGLIMWVPGGLVFLAAALALLGGLLKGLEREAAAP